VTNKTFKKLTKKDNLLYTEEEGGKKYGIKRFKNRS